MSRKNESIFDKRICPRNIRRGTISQKDYDNYLSKLPDAAKKAVPLFGELHAAGDRRREGRRETDPRG